MPKQPGFWSVEDRLRALSAQGDPLAKLLEIVDFELFRPVLDGALGGSDRSKGGRPPFDAVLNPDSRWVGTFDRSGAARFLV